jgi:hypothetical protein
MLKQRMVHGSEARQLIASERGPLQKLLLVQLTGARQPIVFDVQRQQVVEEGECSQIAQSVVRQVDVTKVNE